MKTFIKIGEAAKSLGVEIQWLRTNYEAIGLSVMLLPSGHRLFVKEEIDEIVSKMTSGKTLKLAQWRQ